jgi:TolA-binding protein
MKKLILLQFCIVVLATLILSGCLKTRAQLRGEADDYASSAPVPAQIQDVQPQGQYAIDEIKSEITRLNGRIEDLERENKQAASSASATNKDDLKKLEQRIIELEEAQANMLETLKKMQANTPAPDRAEVFQKGKAAYKNEEYDQAIESLTEYLRATNAKQAEEATYLRAESHFALKNYKKAITDYSKFPEKFTQSKRMPQVLLRIGTSFEALGMKEDAQSFYQEIIDKFPKSAEAKKAAAKLPKQGKAKASKIK